MINILNNNNSTISCRAIIDTGSTSNFITQELASKLKVQSRKCHIPIGALNELTTYADEYITTTIISRNNGYKRTIDFLVVPKIISNTPDQHFNHKSINLPSNIKLADPEFYNPSQVHVLLGTGISLSILCVGQIKLSQQPNYDLYAQKTLLGWIIGGTTNYKKGTNRTSCNVVQLESEMNRFWEIEEGPTVKLLSKQESACEEHYKKHVKRNPDGRYVVALPFNDKKNQLGSSRDMAVRRLLSLEKRFERDNVLYQQYKSVIDEYIQLGHMIKIQDHSSDGFYLPHHAVTKESSLTTKLRVVFDGSAASSTGISLNDTLMVGPIIQDDLFSCVLRFRIPNYLITGDIEKMFRQILIREEDQKYLKILWREEDGSISTYQLTTDTFGLGPASFLAIRTIHQLADDEKQRFPRAAESFKRCLYVDDFLDGAESIEETIKLRDDVINLLKLGGFNLRQCASNSPEVLQGLPSCSINKQLQDKNNPTLKTLGMHWNSENDEIIYTVKSITIPLTTTKRTIFSEVAKIFDPLGLLNPAIVPLKLLIQDIWKLKLDWDESLPLNIQTKWFTFISQLPALNHISFRRRMLHEHPINVQLHGFCDASEKAYGACIYLRSVNDSGEININLLCAKSKVAPIKTTQTIPKLELCAAKLLADLYTAVKPSLNSNIDQTIFWTDSMITLHWINKSPDLLLTFVSNRVSEIQRKTNILNWRHVRTQDNPADLLSRGVLPQELDKSIIWREGPNWLSEKETNWPQQISLKHDEALPELRKMTCLVTLPVEDDILQRYSSFDKLQRIIAICLRFKGSNKFKGSITSDELQLASTRIYKLVQQSSFPREVSRLQRGLTIENNSKILALHPFLDKGGIMRVGGRLHNSNLPFKQQHPILLPKSNHITNLLITREHISGLHTGVKTTLSNLHLNYWIIDGRNQVRRAVRNCVRCARANPMSINYIMGNLPKVRTTQARPFLNTGVDYCGPFYIKEKKFRNKNKIKVYVAIFVCLASKAVHIEVVTDLTTEGFIGALRRFISRRGYCASIYSDNGTNFVGANNQLQEIYGLISSKSHNNQIDQYLAHKNINWHFIPPQSPHVGGIWEAAVKSFKHHLIRVVGANLFTLEQFNTLIIEIEAILNSRPLTPLSPDPNDPPALTPAHLLIGDSLKGLPEENHVETPSNRLSLWKHIQKVKQDFWTRWHKEYLHELNVRHKWAKGEHSIKKDSIVIIRDDNSPPLQWPIGRVIETQISADGVIRTVRVKTATGILVRNVKRLSLLPLDISSDN